MTLAFRITGQTLRPCGIQPRVASGSVEFVHLQFQFDQDWDNLTKVAQFAQGAVYHQVLDDNGGCILPSEIITGVMDVMVFGQEPGGTIRATTHPLAVPIVRSGFVGDGTTPIPPTPDLYAQLLAQIDAGGDATGVIYGDGLKLTSGVLSVDTTNTAEQDNTKPITSAGVYTEIGNINAILATI